MLGDRRVILIGSILVKSAYFLIAPDPRAMLHAKLRLGMLIHGVDLKGSRGGLLSAVHDDDDVERTTEAWRKSLRMLKEEGELDD